MRDVPYLNQRCPISRLKMSYILWRRLLLKTVASRQAKPPFRWPLLLPSATRMAFAICWQCAFYGSQVAEVAVFVTKKFLQNLNFRKFLPQEFWESLPSFVQMAVFTFGKGHSADELAALSKRIMLSTIHALPEMFVKLREQIHAGSNPLLMCTLYYVCFDHGLPRSAMALGKVSLGAKQISYIRESVKAIVEKLMETSVTNALDKKAEWTKQIKDVEDAELKQAMKNTLRDTKGKHGRRTFLQEEQSIDDILIADDKQALKETIRTALNEMEHEYESAYIKAALIRSHHLAPHASFSVFLRAISDFMGREYKYDPAQRVDSFIYHNEKEFQTS